MTRRIVILVILAVIGIGGYLVTVKYVTPRVQQVVRVVGLLEKALPMLAHNTEALDSVFRYLEGRDPMYDSLLLVVTEQSKEIAKMEKHLADLPVITIPDIDYVNPETYEDCLQALEQSRKTSEQLVEVIEHQREEIRLLRAVNIQQGVIIKTQAYTIEKKDLDMALLRGSYDDVIREAQWKKWFGYLVGAAGVIAGFVL